MVPILVSGIGDGLAEPVGVRFGRLKYKTYALFSKIKYERTVEGSACVFITSIIVIIFFQSSFTYSESNPSTPTNMKWFLTHIHDSTSWGHGIPPP